MVCLFLHCRLISETSLYLLGVTMLASLLHLIFECLAFQSDISFWQENKSLAGLSARTLVTDLASQLIVFLFLVDSDTSLLVTIPAFFGLLIQAWKVQKATGLSVARSSWGLPVVVFRRWECKQEVVEAEKLGFPTTDGKEGLPGIAASVESVDVAENIEQRLTVVTLEADRYDGHSLILCLCCINAVFAQICHHISGRVAVSCCDGFYRAVAAVRAAPDVVLLADRRVHELRVHLRLRAHVPAAVHQPPAQVRLAPALEGMLHSH